MRNNIFTKVLIVLLTVFNWGCSNDDIENTEPLVYPIDESIISSRSANEFDYSQYTLLENKTIMPRTGDYFQGTVTYKDTAFPVHIYWDLEIENYNIYAYISGSNYAGYFSWDPNPFPSGSYYAPVYRLDHVATYLSACSESIFDLVIQCNFSHLDSANNCIDANNRHVSFHVIFYPSTRDCSFDIIEDGEGWWRILEVD